MLRSKGASVGHFLLRRIEEKNGIDSPNGIRDIYDEVLLRRREIENHLRNRTPSREEEMLYEKFIEYDEVLERLILAKRVESGVSTLLFFLYSILTGIGGIIMEILALLTTVGLVGHVILTFSIAGGVIGVIFAMYSLKKERGFIVTLRNGI